MKLTLSRIEQITQAVKAFELRDTAGAALSAFESGAHIELHLSPGLMRRYSLTSDPSVSHYTIAVLHHLGGRGSSLLHQGFKAADTIEAEAPRAGKNTRLVDVPKPTRATNPVMRDQPRSSDRVL